MALLPKRPVSAGRNYAVGRGQREVSVRQGPRIACHSMPGYQVSIGPIAGLLAALRAADHFAIHA